MTKFPHWILLIWESKILQVQPDLAESRRKHLKEAVKMTEKCMILHLVITHYQKLEVLYESLIRDRDDKCFIYMTLNFHWFFFSSCPVRKKRLTEAGLCAGPNDWILCTHQDIESHGVNPCTSDLPAPGMLDVLCEEMDQTTGEPQCEVARRRLQEIEDR